MELLDRVYWNNSILLWLTAVGVFALAWIGLTLLKWVVVNRIGAWAKKTSTDIDDFMVELLADIKPLFIIVISLILGGFVLRLSPLADLVLYRILVVILLLQAMFWGSRFIEFLISRSIRRRSAGASPEMEASLRTSMSAVRLAGRMVLFVIVFLLILDNLGINVTALVAGLGVGGIAVALAVQNILGDLFASLSIVLDKPFVLGDFIIVGGEMGTVEKIGLKTTRVKSLSGEQIIFSNTDLLQSRVRNYKRMAERRVTFRFGVTYQTPLEKLRQIPDIVRQIIGAIEKTRFDRAHFQKFGDSSLDFEVVYYILSAEYNLYAAIENEVNLELFRRFEEQGISFAYPTRTLYIDRMPEAEAGDGRSARAVE